MRDERLKMAPRANQNRYPLEWSPSHHTLILHMRSNNKKSQSRTTTFNTCDNLNTEHDPGSVRNELWLLTTSYQEV